MKKDTPEAGKRKRGWFFRFCNTEIPLAVYAAIFVTMALLWVIQEVHEDVTLGLFTELGGAAFTLFIIDTLLVRSKTRRWRLVQDHIDYLIARHVNRLRDGIAVRVFGFHTDVPAEMEAASIDVVRAQRAGFLQELESLDPDQL